MDVFAGITIQETVHLVSMFNYMNTLSDFLFSKSFIDEEEKCQLLAVANGIYRYIEDDTPPIGIQERKRILIKEAIRESDIYSDEEKENPNAIFVNELFRRIIISIVFNDETNIYGFIIKVIRNSKVGDVGKLLDKIREELNQTLPGLVFERVFNDYILPMFPQPVQNLESPSAGGKAKAKAALAESLLVTEAVALAESLTEAAKGVTTKLASSVEAAVAESSSVTEAEAFTAELAESSEPVIATLVKSLSEATTELASSVEAAVVEPSLVSEAFTAALAESLSNAKLASSVEAAVVEPSSVTEAEEFTAKLAESLSKAELTSSVEATTTSLPEASVNLTSMEFLYSQAGAIFLLSSSSHPEMNKFLTSTGSSKIFHEYLHLAFAMKQLLNANKIDIEFIRIFTLPALIYYVWNNREKLVNETTADIVTNAEHVRKALEQLFFYLNEETDSQRIIVEEKNLLYQHQLGMAFHQSRTEIARNLIGRRCLLTNGIKIDDEVTRYKNNPGTFSCDGRKRGELLASLDNWRSYELWSFLYNGGSEEFLGFTKGNVSEMLQDVDNGNVNRLLLDLINGNVSNLLLDLNNGNISNLLLDLNDGNISELLLDLNNRNISELLLILSSGNISELILNLNTENINNLLLDLNNGNVTNLLLDLNKRNIGELLLILSSGNISGLILNLNTQNVSNLLLDLNNGNISNLLLDLNNGNISELLLILSSGNISGLLLNLNTEKVINLLLEFNNGNIIELLLNLNTENINNLLLDLNNENISNLLLDFINRSISGLLQNSNNRNISELLLDLNNRNIIKLLLDLNNGNISNLLLNFNNLNISEFLLKFKNQNISGLLQNLNNENISYLLLDLNNGNISNLLLDFNNRNISGLLQNLNNGNISELLLDLNNINIIKLLLDFKIRNISNLLMDLRTQNIKKISPILNNGKISRIFLNLVTRKINKLPPSPNNTTTTEFLPNLNGLFHQQNELIAKNYFHYEKYVIEKLFGDKFIETLNNESVEISQGFFKTYCTGRPFDFIKVQQLRNSDDLLKFHYFPSGKIVYFALIRTNDDIKLISEFGNERFRQQLGLSANEKFEKRNFKLIKEAGENFTIFVNRLAREREEMLRRNLDAIGYDATVQEVWFEYFFNLLTISFSVSSFLKLLTVLLILFDLKFSKSMYFHF
ncbi:putative uncharacterized protein DDB_G0277255 [Leptopilina heterotoma]|uniref:putative uncharacterized protein DDB_G0277255 n=1 Tax=Leptopilina heterotoma TaxID=63436 RepID=UPI001CA8089D|nr:putative uncharacterized protein DDB_G0277255 [Leptopilina heterotoma]